MAEEIPDVADFDGDRSALSYPSHHVRREPGVELLAPYVAVYPSGAVYHFTNSRMPSAILVVGA